MSLLISRDPLPCRRLVPRSGSPAMSIPHSTTPEVATTTRPTEPHCLRKNLSRGGNGKKYYWACLSCQQRILEIQRSTGKVLYYQLPPCATAAAQMAAHEPGMVTDVGRAPPSKQPRCPTPPYPFLDRPALAQPLDGEPAYVAGGLATEGRMPPPGAAPTQPKAKAPGPHQTRGYPQAGGRTTRQPAQPGVPPTRANLAREVPGDMGSRPPSDSGASHATSFTYVSNTWASSASARDSDQAAPAANADEATAASSVTAAAAKSKAVPSRAPPSRRRRAIHRPRVDGDMSVSEAGEWYDLSETERLHRQEAESLRTQNASLAEEVQRLQVQLAAATAATTAIPEEEGGEEPREEQPTPTGA